MKKLLIIALSCIALGCKVSYSFRGGEIPGQTFSIESFTNTATLVNPNLAIVMQDELQERFTNESNLKYTNGVGEAHFKGVITKYAITPLQGTGNEIVALNRLTISVKVTYTNSENDAQDFDKTFTSFDDFESTEDFSSIEDALMESISEKLVALVYNETLMEW
ncbi:MAG: LPS assembly lipoprotein LptE [Flavobacteriales bacterium]